MSAILTIFLQAFTLTGTDKPFPSSPCPLYQDYTLLLRLGMSLVKPDWRKLQAKRLSCYSNKR